MVVTINCHLLAQIDPLACYPELGNKFILEATISLSLWVKSSKRPLYLSAFNLLTTGDDILQPSQSHIGVWVERIPLVSKSFIDFPACLMDRFQS